MQSQAQLSRQHSHGSLQSTKPSELIPKRRGVWTPTYVPTEQHYMPESTTTEGAPVAEGLYRRRPTPLETQEKKRQRQKHTHHWLQFTRAQLQTVDPRQNQPIKLELELLTHTYTAKYLRVHLRVLGVYKGSRVV